MRKYRIVTVYGNDMDVDHNNDGNVRNINENDTRNEVGIGNANNDHKTNKNNNDDDINNEEGNVNDNYDNNNDDEENDGNNYLPEANRRDYEELPEHIRTGMQVHFASHFREVAEIIFG